MVSELCSILENEHLVPMLYADLKNSVSNQVYNNIGFEEGRNVTFITGPPLHLSIHFTP
ncbi:MULTISPECIES: hypothetical protein [unclassified Paenibacillus]|uniref:hypothetical protein n=1 Tax=unclassified Paenibacillus TaxID=185978 RepID=UPI001F33860F|nr:MULTISPECIES: hypothetical protein [unclassified Paenibacillus]